MDQPAPQRIFQGNRQVDYAKITSCFQAPKKRFGTGETIYTFGEQQDLIGILESGHAVMSRMDIDGSVTVLERLSDGGIFGEIIAFSPLPNDNISVTAESECSVLFISYQKVIHPCNTDCDCHRVLIDNLFHLISQKAIALSERVEILSCKTIREKLICYFRISSIKQGKLCFELPFSLSALSDYICSDRSAMMRELKKLRQSGLLVIHHRNVCIDAHVFELGQDGL